MFTQNGTGFHTSGDIFIDCKTHQQDDWQEWEPSVTGAKYGLSIQSGHACAGDVADYNLDNIHVKYGNTYIDIARSTGKDGKCSEHDKGVSCIIPVRAASTSFFNKHGTWRDSGYVCCRTLWKLFEFAWL